MYVTNTLCIHVEQSGRLVKRPNRGCVPPKGYSSDGGFPSLGGDNENNPSPHCFCGPCIVEMPPDFLVGSSTPHARNREQRYKLYRKFWQTLKQLGLWQHPSYKRRKTEKTAEDDPREIFPDCILQVRHLHIYMYVH